MFLHLFLYLCTHKKVKGLELRKITNDTVKIALPMLLGGAILYWMYHGFDFKQIEHVLLHEMNWTWMILSFPFGIMAQVLRGWRWKQTLAPIGEKPRTNTCVNSIFLSYASSLIIPRIGEFARCAALKRYDGISFSKALGTVVTERVIDSLLVLIITGTTLLMQLGVFSTFFYETGTSMDDILSKFSTTGYVVTIICALATIFLVYIMIKKMSIYNKVKDTITGLWMGIISLKNVKNIPLFLFYSLAIWGSYFLHYYLTFFCFGFTSHLGIMCAMVTFAVGSIAVIVPTPNGAGPWHFAVKTMLVLYGVSDSNACIFVLIVHTVQTMLVILLGVYSWGALAFTKRKTAVA